MLFGPCRSFKHSTGLRREKRRLLRVSTGNDARQSCLISKWKEFSGQILGSVRGFRGSRIPFKSRIPRSGPIFTNLMYAYVSSGRCGPCLSHPRRSPNPQISHSLSQVRHASWRFLSRSSRSPQWRQTGSDSSTHLSFLHGRPRLSRFSIPDV